MNDVPPGSPSAITFEDPDQRGGLPVALGAEAVAVGHQPLDADARELLEAAEVLERVGEGAEAALVEEAAQPGLDPAAVAQLGVPLAARWPERRRHVVVARRTRRRGASTSRVRRRAATRSTRSPTP